MKYRITQEEYYKIFNNTVEINDCNKISFDMMIDLYQDILSEFEKYQDVEISKIKDKKKEIIIYSLYQYLFKVMNTYSLLISGSHKTGAIILTRTIFEIYIKIYYLLSVDNEETYNQYICSSLIAEKFYLNELDGFKSFEKEYIASTKVSIFNLLNNSGVEDVSLLNRKANKFPNIEEMCKYLVGQETISNAAYNIAYRTYSNYTHANWSAIENEAFRNKSECVDIRLIAPISVMIIDVLVFTETKMKYFAFDFIKKLKIYRDAFIILDKKFVYENWVKK